MAWCPDSETVGGLAGRALALLLAAAAGQARAVEQVEGARGGAAAAGASRVVRDGVVVDFSISRPGEEPGGKPLMEGEYAEVRFRMTDAATGRPVPGL
ncbi:MAG: hypothetical protein NDI82_09005, partial [Anaeromyxobacteraceae bacterium]|nr:hypothetical protein [Anaeromyxobacteraceae bacterium]